MFQDAKRTAKLCKALAAKVKAQLTDEITAIVSPAVGGIVPGYEMGRQLGLPAMYVERVDGEFQLRRNFTLKRGQKVLMAPKHPHDAMTPPPPFPYYGLEHFGFTVENLDATLAELKAKGATIAVGPVTRDAGTYLAFVRGPDGIMVELVEKRRSA